MSVKIKVDHLARVEGHGGITVAMEDGKISQVEFDVFEGARLLEGLMVGRSYEDISQIVSRICAICSVGHALTALQAIENAFGVEVSYRTQLLRDLQVQGENIESHALHLFLLALPDFLGYPSAIALAADIPEGVKLGLRLKKLGNTIQEVVGGRAVHQVNAVVGGYGKLPSVDDLVELRSALEEGRSDSEKMIDIWASIEIPDFSDTPTVYAALESSSPNFSLFGERIALSTGEKFPVADYRKLTNERPVPHSNAKHSYYNDRPFMVGALARLSLNGGKLRGGAREAVERLNLPLPKFEEMLRHAPPSIWSERVKKSVTYPTGNALHNNTAQAVELVYSIERAMDIVKELLETGTRGEKLPEVQPRAAAGVGGLEVPRGTLYHSYVFDENGKVKSADVITPTAQNLASLENHFRATIQKCAGDAPDALKFKLEMVARAYDPCISCSVHLIEKGMNQWSSDHIRSC